MHGCRPRFSPISQALTFFAFSLMISTSSAWAAKYSASFQNTDIQEFISTVSHALNKTVIIQPGVSGNITVKSFETLDEEQYYQFFLNVLDVQGYNVIEMENNVIKIVPSKLAYGNSSLINGKSQGGDSLTTRVVDLKNTLSRDIITVLEKADGASGTIISSFDASNTLLMVGKSRAIDRLTDLIDRLDKSSDRQVDVYTLHYASANDLVTLAKEMFSGNKSQAKTGPLQSLQMIADERTNSVLVMGEQQIRRTALDLLKKLDQKQDSQGKTRVFYLKYAQAKSLLDVLAGISADIENRGKNASSPSSPALLKGTSIKADEQTNALIITAQPDLMVELENVINQLDIRRAQVLVEAVIVELQDAEGLNLGVQWFNQNSGGTNFPVNTANAIGLLGKDSLANSVKNLTGLGVGFTHNNWAVLVNALKSNTNNDILATPSIVTLDNIEAIFSVGQEVPVLTGSQTTNSDNVFNTVERKNVGIKLKVKPQINQGDSVFLQIEQEVSSVAENSSANTENLGVTFNTRTLTNSVLVGSGETVVVGGLLDTMQSNVEQKVPLLGDIPLIGRLFSSSVKKKVKRNLMLFIRPTIIRSGEEYQGVSSRKFNAHQDKQFAQKRLEELPAELEKLRDADAKRHYFKMISEKISAFNGTGG